MCTICTIRDSSEYFRSSGLERPLSLLLLYGCHKGAVDIDNICNVMKCKKIMTRNDIICFCVVSVKKAHKVVRRESDMLAYGHTCLAMFSWSQTDCWLMVCC
jgi:hypothetical protein